MKSKRTFYIKIIKIVTFMTAALILGVMLLLPLIHSPKEKIQLKAPPTEPNVQNSCVNNPVIYGKDNAGRPYTLKGDYGVKIDQQQMELHKINGTWQMKPDNKLTMMANKGKVLAEQKKVFLQDEVIFTTTDGYRFTTQQIDIDYAKQSAIANTPIHFSGSFGSLHSNNMQITPNMEAFHFKGNIKLVIAR